MPDKYFGSHAGKVTIKGGRADRSQRQILGRALQYADKVGAPYGAKKALIEALIVESEAKNLSTPSADGYGSYGVLQGLEKYHGRKNLMNPEYQFSVFLGKNKKWPKGFTSKGNAIELAKKGMKSGDIAQAVEGSAYPERYGQVGREAAKIIKLFRAASGGAAIGGGSSGGSKAAPSTGGATSSSKVMQDAIYADRRQQVVKDMLTADDPTSPLLQANTLNKDNVSDAADLIKQTEEVKAMRQAVKSGGKPKSSSTGGASAGGSSSVKGKYTMAAGADRAGVKTQKPVLDFVGTLAGRMGKTLHIGTGTNHSQMTTSGNVSDHWTGHAVDIPSSGTELTRMGQRALMAAGIPWSKAKTMRGGIYNVTYRGKRMQIIFNTTDGGNHWNHLHIGLQ